VPLWWCSYSSGHARSWLGTLGRRRVGVCSARLRERCSGLFTTTTMTATAHHSATSSQPILTQSAPKWPAREESWRA